MKKYLLSILLFLPAFVFAQPGSGQMLELNGSSSYVNCGTINNSGGQITLQGWVYVDAFKASFPYISSFIGTETTGNQACVRFGDANLAANKVQFVLLFGSTHVKLNGVASLESDRWYHIAATYDGTGMKIYINGVLDASNTQTGSFTSNSSFALGRNYGNDRILNGYLDEMSVFSTALSQSTIRDWMCKRITSSHPDYSSLVGYWPLDEGTGTSTSDESGNSNNGTLVSSPSWENSGAPIGDRSKHIYASTYSIGISHPEGDSIHFDHLFGSTQGVHLYRVDSAPYETSAPTPLLYLDTARYWGIFDLGNTSYEVTYYYDGNSFIGSNDDCFIGFGNREDGYDNDWNNVNFNNVNYTSQFVQWQDSLRSENILALSANGPHAFTFDFDEPNCNDMSNGSITTHVTGGEGPYSFDWYNGSNDSTASGLSSGYHVFTVTDNNGCESVDSAFLDEPAPVIGTTMSTNASCRLIADGSASVSASGGTNTGYTYLWNDANGSTTSYISNVLAGTYMVTITDTNDCEGVASVIVSSTGPDPIPDLGPDTNVCGNVAFGLTATVQNGPATNFNWSTGETGPIKVVTMSGTYILTVSNNEGCEGIDTIEITYVVPDQVNIPTNGTGTGSYTIDASAGFLFYEWSTSETGQSITVTTSGSYSVTATDSNGCQSSDTINVTIKPAGLSETAKSQWKLSPNPAQDQIQLVGLKITEVYTISIFDLTGRIVFKSDANESALSINLSDFESGKYFLRISNNHSTEMHAFVKL